RWTCHALTITMRVPHAAASSKLIARRLPFVAIGRKQGVSKTPCAVVIRPTRGLVFPPECVTTKLGLGPSGVVTLGYSINRGAGRTCGSGPDIRAARNL